MKHPRLPNIWTSRGDWETFAALGPSAIRREIFRRVRCLDPLPENGDITSGRLRSDMKNQIDQTQWDNFKRLENRAFFADQRQIFQDTRADWRATDNQLQVFAGRMLTFFNGLNVPMFVHSAFRTREEQRAIVSKGNSRAQWPTSKHNTGHAIDLVHGIYAWDMTDREWLAIGKVGKEIWRKMMADIAPSKRRSLVWGGDWKFYDPAHWEITPDVMDVRLDEATLLSIEQNAVPVRLTRKNLYDRGQLYGFSNTDMFPEITT